MTDFTFYSKFNFLYNFSGAEDKKAYLWDRFYGVCLSQYQVFIRVFRHSIQIETFLIDTISFQHDDVVNSVAFNPKNNHQLVTVSDDYKVKGNFCKFYSEHNFKITFEIVL